MMLWVVFIVGLCVGSFLNVVGLRFLSEESIVWPASHCPQCQAVLKPYDNIPLLSYLLLRGKCRACHERISLQYPLIELLTGGLFVLTVATFGVQWMTLLLLFLVANLVVIVITDWRESLIFEINSLSLIPAGLIYSVLTGLGFSGGQIGPPLQPLSGLIFSFIPQPLLSSLMGIAFAFVFFEGMIFLSSRCFGTEGFGHGDTHLMMGAGAFLGWPLTPLALFLGFIIQAVPAFPMLIWQWIQTKAYTSLFSALFGILGALVPLLLTGSPIPPLLRLGINLLCIVVSLVSLIIFFRQIKQSQQFTYLPLGPALVLGVLLSLFYGAPLLKILGWGH